MGFDKAPQVNIIPSESLLALAFTKMVKVHNSRKALLPAVDLRWNNLPKYMGVSKN